MSIARSIVSLSSGSKQLTTFVLSGARYVSLSSVYFMKKPVFDGPHPPKRPGSAYSVFIRENFHKDMNNPVTGIDAHGRSIALGRMKELAQQWRLMNKSDQQQYYDIYVKQNESYQSEKKQFFDKMSKEQLKEYKLQRSKYLGKCRKYDEIQKRKKDGTYDPPPRKVSGLNLYISEQLSQTTSGTVVDHRKNFSEACKRWNSLTDDEKKPYIDESESITKQRLAEYYERHPEYVPKDLRITKGSKKKK